MRDARDTDRREVSRVIETAFGHAGVARLWSDLEDRDLVRRSLVAVADDRVVGHVGLSHAWLDTRRALLDVLLMGPLSVDPDHHGKRLGTALLAAAVEAARTTDAPMVVLEGSPRFYGERGFAPGAAHGIEPASRRIPAPACRVLLLETYEPWMTGRIIYRDVWWEHDSAGLRDPDLAEVERALSLPDGP